MSFRFINDNYKTLINDGYDKRFLNQNLHIPSFFAFFSINDDCNSIDYDDEYIKKI